MRMTKLTLSADRNLVLEAKKLSRREGTSLSSMVTRFLQSVLAERSQAVPAGPITQRATGLIRLPAGRSDRELLSDALADRHGFKR